MAIQSISTQPTARVHIIDCQGDLVIQPSDSSTVAFEDASDTPQTQQEGETLVVRPAPGNLRLHVPTAAAVIVENIRGALHINGISAVNVDLSDGDVRIEAIRGAVTLRDLKGDLHVSEAGSLKLEDEPRDRKQDWRERGVRDAFIQHVRVVEIENINRDLELREAQTAQVENIGGSCTVDAVAGDLQIANIGGSCAIKQVGGNLQLDNVGGSTSLSGIGSVDSLGNIGGSLTMNAATLNAFSLERPTHIAVGGSTRIELPEKANVTILATAGGSIRAQDGFARGPGIARLVYGNGAAHLHIIAGGSIDLLGNMPQQTGSSWSEWKDIGVEIGRAVGDAFSTWGRGENQPRKANTPLSPPPATGPTVRMNSIAPENAADREALLRMVAAGQISPKDADAMLEAFEG